MNFEFYEVDSQIGNVIKVNNLYLMEKIWLNVRVQNTKKTKNEPKVLNQIFGCRSELFLLNVVIYN